MSEKEVLDGDEKVEERVPKRLLLNVKEVAEVLGVSERTIWKLASCGKVPAPLNVGRSKRWSRKALAEWIAEHHKAAQRR